MSDPRSDATGKKVKCDGNGCDERRKNRKERSGTSAVDTVFGALADRRRRYVLYHLRDSCDDVTSFDDLLEDMMDRDTGQERRDREQVVSHLHHVTLPKLTEAGLIEYDPRSETIRYRGGPLVEGCLDHASDHER